MGHNTGNLRAVGLPVIAQPRLRGLKLRYLHCVPGTRIVNLPHNLPCSVPGQEPFPDLSVKRGNPDGRGGLAIRRRADSANPPGAPVGV